MLVVTPTTWVEAMLWGRIGCVAQSLNTPQYVKYTFYKVEAPWRRLPLQTRSRDKRELVDVLEGQQSSGLIVRVYSLMGMRADTEMLVWCVSPNLERLSDFAASIASTHLGTHLVATHSYLAMTRRSVYIDGHNHQLAEDRTQVRPMGSKYLFVYPFVKTHDWYQLDADERQRMMGEHFKVGHRYPDVKIHTSYSFGLDDQEFVLGFETDDPARFLELVMELRFAEQRPYTERDVPIFTCIHGSADDVLGRLGG